MFADLAGLQLITFSDSLQHWSPRWIYWRGRMAEGGGLSWWGKVRVGEDESEVIRGENSRWPLKRGGQWMSLMLPAFTCWRDYSPKGVKSHAGSHSSFLCVRLFYCLSIVSVWQRSCDPRGNCLSAYNKGKACDRGLHFSGLIVRDNTRHWKHSLRRINLPDV